MRQWFILLLAFVPFLALRAAAPDEAKKQLAEILKATDYAFTPKVRQAYLDYMEAVVRETYGPNKINETTWKWLKQRPTFLSAVASAAYPVNPNIVLNLQRLGLALGPERLQAWQQLALAYAIRYRDQLFPIDRVTEAWNPARLESVVSDKKKGKGGDFALVAPEDYPEGITEEERRLGQWIAGPQSLITTRPPLTIPELMEMPVHEINMMTRQKPDDPPMISKFPDWERVALGGGIFPPYVDGTPTPQRAVLMKIWRNGRIPGKSDRPNFRMEKSEWPILLYAADLDHLDETSFLFNYFVTNKKVAPLGLGQKASASGGNDINPGDPNFRFAKSNWHPRKFIRVYNGSKKDQGGKAWAWGLNALNVAATAVAAPPDGKFYFMGEKGNYTYHMTCSDNSFTGTGSSAAWHLAAPLTVDDSDPFAKGAGTFGASGGGMVLHRNFMGLAATLNQGLQEYEDARIGLFICSLLNLSSAHRTALLESLFLKNPLNADLVYALAAEYRRSGDANDTLRLLTAARAYAAVGLKLPVSPQSAKNGRAAMAKFFKAKEPTYQSLPVVKVSQSPWFFLLCADVATQHLRDSGGKDKAAFRSELDYLTKAAEGCGDQPIVRAVEALRELVN